MIHLLVPKFQKLPGKLEGSKKWSGHGPLMYVLLNSRLSIMCFSPFFLFLVKAHTDHLHKNKVHNHFVAYLLIVIFVDHCCFSLVAFVDGCVSSDLILFQWWLDYTYFSAMVWALILHSSSRIRWKGRTNLLHILL